MAAPVHYIRTIHTSFTAAHSHSPSAWATHASPHNILLNLTNMPSLSKYPPGLVVTTGRKRSHSIRGAPPAYTVQRMQPQRVKFDPFADEPENGVLYNTAPSSRTRPVSIPYTIQIPPAAPADIQRHHQQQQHYRHHQQHHHHPSPHHHHSPQAVRVRQQSPPAQRPLTPAPVAVAPVAVPRSPSPPVSANAAKEREARSKIVAGILLNRVHAVGKPMRRRSMDAPPRPYVPSGLSTCIAIEA